MNESKTPLTDTAIIGHFSNPEMDYVNAEHARSLEVRLAEANEAVKELNELRKQNLALKFLVEQERDQLVARVKLLEAENAQNNAASVTFDLCVAQARVQDLEQTVKAYTEFLTAAGFKLQIIDGVIQETPIDFLQDLERKAKAFDWIDRNKRFVAGNCDRCSTDYYRFQVESGSDYYTNTPSLPLLEAIEAAMNKQKEVK